MCGHLLFQFIELVQSSFFIALNKYLWYSLFIVIIEGRKVMNKQIILEQCDKIKNVVTEATQNEEEARSNAEKFKGINIKKKTSITSMFRIGQDNILSYKK